MDELARARRAPFVVAAVFLAVVCIAVARLPDPFVLSLETGSPLETSAQAGWAFRLLALAAIAQAIYGGFSIFRIERVQRAREDPKTAALEPTTIVRSVARTGAAMVFLTSIYGLAALGVTGQRGGFWLFPVVAIAQGAWYFRQIGEIARWLSLQPARPDAPRAVPWRREPPGYCPPLARAMADASREEHEDPRLQTTGG